MKDVLWILLVLFVSPLLVWPQSHGQTAAVQEVKQVKSLSDSEIQGYLNGRGMGLAKPAELNGYPGPMHALELGEKLNLTAAQRAETQTIFERMKNEAVPLGRSIVAKEAELNALFAEGKANDDDVRSKVEEIARLQGKLRLVHLTAHLEMKRLLTPEQIRSYDKLRGYADKDKESRSNQHHPRK